MLYSGQPTKSYPVESHRLINKAHRWMITESGLCETALYIMFLLFDSRFPLIPAGGAVLPTQCSEFSSFWCLICDREWHIQGEETGAGFKWELRAKESIQQQRHWNRQTWTGVSTCIHYIYIYILFKCLLCYTFLVHINVDEY